MRFISLFSGIEGASMAFGPLGWEAAAFSEIDPHACRHLAHHYPDVPNLGDVSRITREQIEALGPIDLVCGGFPCQDLSTAGKRAGLRNADGTHTRSGLFFDAMRIVGWARARWLLIENVQGLYSSHKGRDFAAVVGAMAGCEFDVPKGGWRSAGAAVGPHGLVEWRCLDAQFFGLAQRRERVFLVRDSGDWAGRSPVLLEPEGLRGDPAPRRKAGQGIARPIASSPAGGSGYRNDADTADNLIAHALAASQGGIDREDRHTLVTGLPPELLQELPRVVLDGQDRRPESLQNMPVSVDLTNGTLNGTLEAAQSKGNRGHGVLAFDTTQITSATNRCNPRPGDPCHPLAAHAHAPALAFGGNNTTGSIEVATALNASASGRMDFESETFIMAFKAGAGVKAGSVGASDHLSPTLCASESGTNRTPAIAFNARQDPISGPIDTDGTTSAVATGALVRRITPTEAERLQGVEDGHTRIPIRHYAQRRITKLRPADRWEPAADGGWWLMAADGPRYRGLGNGWAVPVVAWIARRIELAGRCNVEERAPARTGALPRTNPLPKGKESGLPRGLRRMHLRVN